MMTRKVVRDFFRDNRERGVDLGSDMLWGFFFVDDDEAMLSKFIPVVTSHGYRLVGILDSSGDNDSDARFLHVETIATHSSDSLYHACDALDALAKKHGVQFDGFDVGNVDGSVLWE